MLLHFKLNIVTSLVGHFENNLYINKTTVFILLRIFSLSSNIISTTSFAERQVMRNERNERNERTAVMEGKGLEKENVSEPEKRDKGGKKTIQVPILIEDEERSRRGFTKPKPPQGR